MGRRKEKGRSAPRVEQLFAPPPAGDSLRKRLGDGADLIAGSRELRRRLTIANARRRAA